MNEFSASAKMSLGFVIIVGVLVGYCVYDKYLASHKPLSQMTCFEIGNCRQ